MDTLLKFLDSKRKELFPCTTTLSSSIIYIQRKHVYLKNISRIKFTSSSNPPPTSFRDALEMSNERIEVNTSSSSSSPPSSSSSLNTNGVFKSSSRRGTFESIGGCLKRMVLQSGAEGISRKEILEGISSCTPQTPGQINAMLRRFDQKGLVVHTGGRYYSSKIKIEVPIITPKRQRVVSSSQTTSGRSKKRVKIQSRHRKRSSAKRSPIFKIQFNGMALCAVHTHLLLTQKVFREIESTSSPTVPFMSAEWFRYWSQHEPSCTSDDLKMLQYLGLVSVQTNRAIESDKITLPLYPGRDMNDTYVTLCYLFDLRSRHRFPLTNTHLKQVHSAS